MLVHKLIDPDEERFQPGHVFVGQLLDGQVDHDRDAAHADHAHGEQEELVLLLVALPGAQHAHLPRELHQAQQLPVVRDRVRPVAGGGVERGRHGQRGGQPAAVVARVRQAVRVLVPLAAEAGRGPKARLVGALRAGHAARVLRVAVPVRGGAHRLRLLDHAEGARRAVPARGRVAHLLGVAPRGATLAVRVVPVQPRLAGLGRRVRQVVQALDGHLEGRAGEPVLAVGAQVRGAVVRVLGVQRLHRDVQQHRAVLVRVVHAGHLDLLGHVPVQAVEGDDGGQGLGLPRVRAGEHHHHRVLGLRLQVHPEFRNQAEVRLGARVVDGVQPHAALVVVHILQREVEGDAVEGGVVAGGRQVEVVGDRVVVDGVVQPRDHQLAHRRPVGRVGLKSEHRAVCGHCVDI
mmetsp:Transcript_26864/g.44367  ORF Transcript_26864/g.44367 Transcript_26864/m.44367 type:complete len:404 (+) Transcript_26864:1733-2944(+)